MLARALRRAAVSKRSTSNRIVLMASVSRGQIAMCDRNDHLSVESAMTMSGAIAMRT
nr:hypothetical protein [Burkholderia metallica]